MARVEPVAGNTPGLQSIRSTRASKMAWVKRIYIQTSVQIPNGGSTWLSGLARVEQNGWPETFAIYLNII